MTSIVLRPHTNVTTIAWYERRTYTTPVTSRVPRRTLPQVAVLLANNVEASMMTGIRVITF